MVFDESHSRRFFCADEIALFILHIQAVGREEKEYRYSIMSKERNDMEEG